MLGMLHQGREQVGFPGRELKRLAVPADNAGSRVVLQRTMLPHRLGTARKAPHDSAQARHQFIGGQRLDQVVIGADIETGNALLDGVARSQDQDRNVQRARASACEPLHYIAAR